MDANCVDTPLAEGTQCLQQIPFSCDSFDAAIAAHISRQQDKTVSQPTLASHASSIWDAEETCDAFSFQKNPVILQEVPSSFTFSSLRGCKHVARINSMGSNHMTEVGILQMLCLNNITFARERKCFLGSGSSSNMFNLLLHRTYRDQRALQRITFKETQWTSVSLIHRSRKQKISMN